MKCISENHANVNHHKFHGVFFSYTKSFASRSFRKEHPISLPQIDTSKYHQFHLFTGNNFMSFLCFHIISN